MYYAFMNHSLWVCNWPRNNVTPREDSEQGLQSCMYRTALLQKRQINFCSKLNFKSITKTESIGGVNAGFV